MRVYDTYGASYEIPGPWESIEDIKNANRNLNRHFFDDATLRFFRSIISHTIYGGRMFITSEQRQQFDGTLDDRRYTIRIASDIGDVASVTEFQSYPTMAEAKRIVKLILERKRNTHNAGRIPGYRERIDRTRGASLDNRRDD